MDEVRRDFRQGLKNKTSLVQARVGDDQAIFRYREVPEEKNVQVYRPRPLIDCADPLEQPAFDPLEFSKQLPRGKRSFQPEDRIEKIGLFNLSDCFRFVKAGQGGDPGPGDFADFGDRPQQVQVTVPLV